MRYSLTIIIIFIILTGYSCKKTAKDKTTDIIKGLEGTYVGTMHWVHSAKDWGQFPYTASKDTTYLDTFTVVAVVPDSIMIDRYTFKYNSNEGAQYHHHVNGSGWSDDFFANLEGENGLKVKISQGMTHTYSWSSTSYEFTGTKL